MNLPGEVLRKRKARSMRYPNFARRDRHVQADGQQLAWQQMQVLVEATCFALAMRKVGPAIKDLMSHERKEKEQMQHRQVPVAESMERGTGFSASVADAGERFIPRLGPGRWREGPRPGAGRKRPASDSAGPRESSAGALLYQTDLEVSDFK